MKPIHLFLFLVLLAACRNEEAPDHPRSITDQWPTKPEKKKPDIFKLERLNGEPIYEEYIDKEPRFKFNGTGREFENWLKARSKYPISANGKEVWVKFVVTKEGSVLEPKIMTSQASEKYNKEAIRIVKSMPEGSWEPGMYEGKAVHFRSTMLIKFDVKD